MKLEVRYTSHFQISLAGACSVLLILGGAQSAQAQRAAPGPPIINPLLADSHTVATAEPGSNGPMGETAKPSELDKPGHDGIKIHGHWVIDVRNPDGKVVQHRDFENSLVTNGAAMSGDQILAALLSGNATVGDPAVVFIKGSINGAGFDASQSCVQGSTVTCWPPLTTAQAPHGQYYDSLPTPNVSGLVTTVNFSPNVNWVLSGNYSVPSGSYTTINAVETLLPLCLIQPFVINGITQPTNPPTPGVFVLPDGLAVLTGSLQGRSSGIASTACAGNTDANSIAVIYGALTAITIANNTGTPTPLTNLVPGQIITVSVTLSFS
jgi:hypothetical protein